MEVLVRPEEEINGIHTGKEEVKPSQFEDDMILHIEKPKQSTKRLLGLINKFNKIAEHKILFENPLFFYTLARKNQKLIYKQTKNLYNYKCNFIYNIIRYLGINLTKKRKACELKTTKQLKN